MTHRPLSVRVQGGWGPICQAVTFDQRADSYFHSPLVFPSSSWEGPVSRDECGFAVMRRVIFFLSCTEPLEPPLHLASPSPLTAVPMQPTRAELSRETAAVRGGGGGRRAGGGQGGREDETSWTAVCQGPEPQSPPPVTPTPHPAHPPSHPPPADSKRMKAFSCDCHS